MRRVFDSPCAAERICTGERYIPEEKYRLTSLCLSIPCDDGTLLFHTLTGALLLLEGEEKAEDYTKELVKDRFFVPESFDEAKYTFEVKRVLSMLRPACDKKNSFTILTTTDCNARCFYCYELNCKRITMSDLVARDTADYISRVSRGDSVKISWFGGEPLYNARAMDVLCTRLKELHVPYSSAIVTNGYLFDEEAATKSDNLWMIKKAQITIDGTQERYLKTKAYIYHDDCAYQRVMRNIECMLEHQIEVVVRLNMNKDNADDLFDLCDELADRFTGKSSFSVYPVLIRGFVSDVGEFDSVEEANERFFALLKKLKTLGLYRLKFDRNLPAHRCMADNDSCEVINPDGSIGKCEHFDGNDLIGSIYSDERDQSVIASWKEALRVPQCGSCPLLPRCIPLKKCAWEKDGCSDSIRSTRIQKFKQMIMFAYTEEKKKTETNR